MKTLAPKKPAKDQREKLILFGLVDLYLQSGKPIGSNTLRENGFEALSSATIRNYFAKLEEEGLVKQQHSSGGRIPTPLAYKIYAEEHLDKPRSSLKIKKQSSSSSKKRPARSHPIFYRPSKRSATSLIAQHSSQLPVSIKTLSSKSSSSISIKTGCSACS